MALDLALKAQLSLPAVCAPMFLVTGPELVVEACKAGLMGGLPRQNARTIEEFESWLAIIRKELDTYKAEYPNAKVGPIAVNLATRLSAADLRAHLAICARYGIEYIITATGDPTELVKEVHDWGGKVFHDVINMKFAEKAIRAGVNGLTCVTAGGGGHSGGMSPLVFIPKVRSIFDGTILLAGCVTNGAAIRAAEILGADLAYMGTRFIASQEARIHEDYRALMVSETSSDLTYTDKIAGVAANWMTRSIERLGMDPRDLPEPLGKGMRHDHLPAHVKPWSNLWSAGQGLDLIDTIPTVRDLVLQLKKEYVAACSVPTFAQFETVTN